MRDFRNKMREKMALLQHGRGLRGALRQRRLLRRREEAPRDAPDGRPRAARWRSSTRPTPGLDIDALRIVAEGVNAMLNPELGVLLITHYQRLLNYITPDVVHVLAQGRIVKSGGKDLALRLEDEGYGPILREAGLRPTLPTRRCSCRRPRPRARARAGGGRPLARATGR